MAGDWIKMRGNLWDDPRVAKLCDMTDQSEAAIVGGLYWLWATADQHTEDGAMPGLTLRQIDRKTGVQGLGAGLVAVGWLQEVGDGCIILGFEQHNGKSAKRRCLEAQRKANGRNVSACDADNAQTDAGQNAPTCGAREEKRREEKEEAKNKGEARKRAAPLDCPEDVDSQVWADWLSLRKTKRAPVTLTVLDGARTQAGKAGLTLESFLRVWCRRGSQGLEADWLKPEERGSPRAEPPEPAWRREQRERNEAFLGPYAAKRKPQPETIDVDSRILGE